MQVETSKIQPNFLEDSLTIGERLRHGLLQRKKRSHHQMKEVVLKALKTEKEEKIPKKKAKNKVVKLNKASDERLSNIQKKFRIIETNAFSEILQHIKPDKLILLDIDNTLMDTTQTLGSDQWFSWRINHYIKNGFEPGLALEKALMEWVAIQCLTDVQIAEPGTDKIVKYMQDEGFRVMGLTTRGASLATRTIQQLHTINLDLSKTAPTTKEVIFLNPHEVIFKNGILFTSGTHKGEALFKFLELSKEEIPLESIEEVLFINDKRAHLEQIKETCAERKMPYLGLRYGYLDDKVNNFSEDLALIQFENFGKILSDNEANLLLKGSI